MNKSLRTLLACSVSALLSLAAVAQNGGASGGKPAPGQEKDKPKPAEAASTKTGTMAPLSLPVTGLTASNSGALTTALTSMHHSVWKCPDCGAAQCTKGTCKACNKEMVEDKNAPALRDVKIDAAAGSVMFALAPGQTLHMSDLESALKANGMALDAKKLAVTNYTRLHVKVPADAKDAATTVQKALTDSKLVSNAAARTDDTTKEVVVLVETKTSPTYADVSSAIEKAGKDFKLADVEWTAPCAACAKAGCLQANCKGCWHDAN